MGTKLVGGLLYRFAKGLLLQFGCEGCAAIDGAQEVTQ